MQNTYAQKNDTVQIASANTAESVRDNSAQAQSLQRKADLMNASVQRAPEPRPNLTGMPDNLKSGIESLSGFSMDDVRVHYNSSKPATVQALAYTQGTDIHVAPGQEHTLPHEAWHVAQQMAGRVSPTTNINGMPVNDNAGLEHEADVMGEKAVQCKFAEPFSCNKNPNKSNTLQRVVVQIGHQFRHQTCRIGVNLMPSGLTLDSNNALYRYIRSPGALSDVIAGHSSLIMHDGTNYDNQNARGFSPYGIWNSLKVGICGLFRQNVNVTGDVHNEPNAITGDPMSKQVLIYVSDATYQLWKQNLPNIGPTGVYSYNPTNAQNANFAVGGTDNCTTFALRNAIMICEGLRNGWAGDLPQTDRWNLNFLIAYLQQAIDAVVARNQARGTARGTQGRAYANM